MIRKNKYRDISLFIRGYLPIYFKGYGILGTPYTSLIIDSEIKRR